MAEDPSLKQYDSLPLDDPPMQVGNDRDNDPKEPERKPKEETK